MCEPSQANKGGLILIRRKLKYQTLLKEIPDLSIRKLPLQTLETLSGESFTAIVLDCHL